MLKFAVLPVFLVLATWPLGAMAADDSPRVAVEGTGRLSAVPDMAVVQIEVVRESTEAGAAMDAASAAVERVLNGIAEAGIQAGDVQTTRIGLEPRWRHSQDGAPPRVVGYLARNALSVKVMPLEGLGPLLDAVVSDGANSMNGLVFDVSDREALEDRARALAVKDAARKAAILAEAAGERLGAVISISEGGGAGLPVQPMMTMREASAVPVAAGEIEVGVSVRVVYSLGQ